MKSRNPTAKRSPRAAIVLFAVVALLAFAGFARAAEVEVNKDLLTVGLKVGHKTLTVEIAQTPETRRVGLMNRQSMPEDHGMIFVFDPPQVVGFWMRNTYIPLSAAFVAEDGTVVHIAHMKPHDESQHSPPSAVRYVIEANDGYFAKAGVAVGDKIDVDLSKAAAPRP